VVFVNNVELMPMPYFCAFRHCNLLSGSMLCAMQIGDCHGAGLPWNDYCNFQKRVTFGKRITF
jgi:hypothetical protein